MSQKFSPATPYFWLLIAVSFSLASLGLGLSWTYGQTWIEVLWHICHTNFQHLQTHLPLAWQLIIPLIMLVMIMRGGLSLIRQLRATRRLTQFFLPLRETPPARLLRLLATHRLETEDIVFLNLPVAHAFCLGFWRPRIWLAAGLVDLLSDEELAVVLAHEAHHCRQRDPLRLLLSRTFKAAFFFLPLVGDLAQAAELQQEVAADRATVTYFGNELPLLCTLQKLLTNRTGTTFSLAAYSPFNVTEARLRRLVYPPPPFNWQLYFNRTLINLGILLILSSLVFWPVQFESDMTDHCTFEPTSLLRIHLHQPHHPEL